MATYLVVAHETTGSPLLLQRLAELAEADRTARFALLVPATHRKHLLPTGEQHDRLLTWDEREAAVAARQRAECLRDSLHEAGLPVVSIGVGDESPMLAIEDELRHKGREYRGLVLATPPPGRSRLLGFDVQSEARRRLHLPVFPVYEGGDEAWSQARTEVEHFGWWDPLPVPGVRRSPPMRLIVALMLCYLSATLLLAIFVDRGFLLNDVVGLVVFGGLIAWLVLMPPERT